MKKYTEMTRKEITDIVNRGGSDRVKLNEDVMDYWIPWIYHPK